MKTNKFLGFTSIVFLCFAVISGLFTPKLSLTTDVVAVNRIQHQAENAWPNLSGEHFSYPLSILDSEGRVVFQTSSETASSLEEAINRNNIILDFAPEGQVIGQLLIHTDIATQLEKQQTFLRTQLALAGGAWLLSAVFYQLYLNKRIIIPFKNLQAFAQRIAAGNLDVPLTMDQGNLFGAFTESFDLMREQLKESQRAEAMANQSKKELVASLSHDIKSPVTSIKLISELLGVTAPAEYKEKLKTIYSKAEQIDHLVTNLFQSALEDLGELQIHLVETDSSVLDRIFKDANYYGKLAYPASPGCLLSVDPHRLEQVIDNIINNSYKYANTDINVEYEISADFLITHISDYGPGAPPNELPHLQEKFFRGANAIGSHMDGSGLGLYIACNLMERMGGEISIKNGEKGLCVTLLLPLA